MQEMRNSRYEANMRVINGTLPFPATGPSLPLPRTRRRAMRMKLRIVDFLNDQGAKFAIEAWARRLGFQTVIVDYAAVEQPSCECGYIAARVMAILRSAGALWGTVGVASANHPLGFWSETSCSTWLLFHLLKAPTALESTGLEKKAP